ncbi:MAG: hypothetical protein EOO61_00765 [Hymenobacter sp.]|nr:MAG: hypothetical protein EOO61_00765 [Hymenobacter sp.]
MSNVPAKLGPEHIEIANGYLTYGTVQDTAEQLEVAQHEVVRILQMPEVKRYLDGIYLDMGYRNRDAIGRAFDKIIAAKLEEAEETGVYSSKDIADLLMMQHKMRMDEIKALKEAGPGVAVQVNNNAPNYGDSNWGRLMEKLTG